MLSRCAVRSAIPIALKRATVAPVVRSPIRHMCQLQQPGKRSGLAVWEWYKECLHTRPLLTKAVTSAVIVATGDILCQLVVERTHALNWMRVGRMGLLGGVLVGPCLHFWYNFLVRTFPAATAADALKRLAMDQFLYAPVFIGVFTSSLMALDGRLAEIPNKLRNQWPGLVVANWKLWMPAQFIMFRFIPVPYQVLWVNGVSIIWNTYLSWSTHK